MSRDAVEAARVVASSLGLEASEAVVLQESNKVTVRLLPSDVLARVAPASDRILAFEIALAERLSGVGALDPRVEPKVYSAGDYVVTFWAYYEPVTDRAVSPVDYADALWRLHREMRAVDVVVPRFTERVSQALEVVGSRDRSPDLGDADREFLGSVLRDVRAAIVERGGREQLLHGEPHPGNLLNTKDGLLFIDLETCCFGPVEFDVAHAPVEVGAHYPGVDEGLLRDCRILSLAIVTAWRWDRDDRLPDGRRLGREWLDEIRAQLAPLRSAEEAGPSSDGAGSDF